MAEVTLASVYACCLVWPTRREKRRRRKGVKKKVFANVSSLGRNSEWTNLKSVKDE